MARLREEGIIVTALHNHWLFENSRLIYMHFESLDEPLSFARKVRRALKVLTTRNIGGLEIKEHRIDGVKSFVGVRSNFRWQHAYI